jgi:DNA repair protein RadC
MRPRERYALYGPERFGDIELLSLILGTGTAERSSLEIAAGLLDRFGDLATVHRAEVRELAEESGIGVARAIRIHAALELGRRAANVPRDPPALVHTADDAIRWLGPRLRGLREEQLHGVFLDRRHRVLAVRTLTAGSDSYTVVDPKQVFRIAFQVRASALMLAHNHPSGDPTPSRADHDVTRRVARAGLTLGIPLLDHLIFAGDTHVSFAEKRWLTPRPGDLEAVA